MRIFDSHMHLPAGIGSLEDKKNALLGEIRRNGVHKGIVISDSETSSPIGSMTDCVHLFENCPDIYVVGGISPFTDYESQLENAEKYISRKKMIGIKLYCGHENYYLNSAVIDPVYVIAEKYDIPVLFHSGWSRRRFSSPQIIRSAALKKPSVRFICCHCCYPDLEKCFAMLKDCNNVYFDVSSVADVRKTRDSVKISLEKAVRVMPDRFIFGSDFGSCNQSEHIDFVNSLEISDYERQAIFYLNAEKVYNPSRFKKTDT